MRLYTALLTLTLGAGCSDDLTTSLQAVSSGWDGRGDGGVGVIARDGQRLCTGSLISARVVLTAAHCTGGTLTVEFNDGPIEVVRLSVAPGYSNQTYVHDLAVLELGREPAGVRPVPVRREALPAVDEGTAVRIVGFGHTDGGGVGTLQRRTGVATLYGADDYLIYTGPGPSQTCHGDSGGPGLMILDGNEVVVGVMSTTDPSCRGWATLTRADVFWDRFIAPFIASAGGESLADGRGAIGDGCLSDTECDTGFCESEAESGGAAVCTHRCTSVEGPGCGADFECRPSADGEEACFLPADPPMAGCVVGGRRAPAPGVVIMLALSLLWRQRTRSDRARHRSRRKEVAFERS